MKAWGWTCKAWGVLLQEACVCSCRHRIELQNIWNWEGPTGSASNQRVRWGKDTWVFLQQVLTISYNKSLLRAGTAIVPFAVCWHSPGPQEYYLHAKRDNSALGRRTWVAFPWWARREISHIYPVPTQWFTAFTLCREFLILRLHLVVSLCVWCFMKP